MHLHNGQVRQTISVLTSPPSVVTVIRGVCNERSDWQPSVILNRLQRESSESSSLWTYLSPFLLSSLPPCYSSYPDEKIGAWWLFLTQGVIGLASVNPDPKAVSVTSWQIARHLSCVRGHRQGSHNCLPSRGGDTGSLWRGQESCPEFLLTYSEQNMLRKGIFHRTKPYSMQIPLYSSGRV